MLDYGITKATPTMLVKMSYGTYLFFSVWTYIGVVWIFFCLPELKGRSLESMDDLFQNSLWSMWRHAYPTEAEKTRHGIAEKVLGAQLDAEEGNANGFGDEMKNPTAIHIERQ
jgi:hypothetical protein